MITVELVKDLRTGGEPHTAFIVPHAHIHACNNINGLWFGNENPIPTSAVCVGPITLLRWIIQKYCIDESAKNKQNRE